MVTDSNQLVLIRSEGRGSVGSSLFYALLPPIRFSWKHQVDHIETGY